MARTKKAFFAVLLVMLLSLAGVTFYYWYTNAYFVRTEDAYIDGTVFKLGPQVAGQLLAVNVKEGDGVNSGEILAWVDDTALPPAGNPELTLVKAPVKGVVLKVLSQPGEVVGAGQPAVMLVDPESLFLTANVEEKKINRIKCGQRVTFTVDGIPGRVFQGRVVAVQEAVASTFSLLPTRSTSGSFIKVVQRVPVKIEIENGSDAPFKVGQSAVVSIHLRD
ncbi:MAG: HlyD family efflux transporter periplasmic adaptor subunit [Bacillota bacterium]